MRPDWKRRSALYHGRVTHCRHLPFRHAFRYRVFQIFLDLDALDASGQSDWSWPGRYLPIIQFRRRDHLGEAVTSLAQTIRDLVEERTGSRPAGPVRVLTNPRYWGFVFNPVSFYYCYGAGETQVEAVVAEVQNTPWNERHCYVLRAENASGETIAATRDKEFHVSPFFDLDMQYRFRLAPPGETLDVSIEAWKGLACQFQADFSAGRWQFTSLNLVMLMMRFPWMTATILFAIYWQALKLWWKGARYVPHPGTTPPHRLTAT